MAMGPAAPPLMRKSPLAEHTLPIGEMTAAVPQAKASFSLPLAASVRQRSIRSAGFRGVHGLDNQAMASWWRYPALYR